MSDAGCFSGIASSLKRKSNKPSNPAAQSVTLLTPKAVSVKSQQETSAQQSIGPYAEARILKEKLADGTAACCCETPSSRADFWDDDAAPLPKYELNETFDADAIKTIENCIKSLDSELRELSLDIHGELPVVRSPLSSRLNELYQTIPNSALKKSTFPPLHLSFLTPPHLATSRHAHDVLTSFMSFHKFTVERHYLLPTAWRASWTQGKGGRTIGFNSEMDALPGIGHACGHNLIAIGGVAAALGVRAALEKSGEPGTVVLLGTPG